MINFNLNYNDTLIFVHRFKLASKLLRQAESSLKLRLLVLPHLTYNNIDNEGWFECADTSPYVIHIGKSGVQELWGLEDDDVVLIGSECFDDCGTLTKAELVWRSVLTACADAWLRKVSKPARERGAWLSRHLGKLSDAVIAAEQGILLDWQAVCRDWKWEWPGDVLPQ